jgi:two-component system, response regulator FlrC
MSNHLLVVEDDRALADALAETLNLAGYTVHHADSVTAALAILPRYPFGLVVSDVHLPAGEDGLALLHSLRRQTPQLPVLLMTAFGSVERAVAAMHAGAVDYLLKPFNAKTLLDAVRHYFLPPVDDQQTIAADPRTLALLRLAERVARSEITVMITGESGSGKEVIARHIHRHSLRAKGPFVAINCAAIPESMLEATLFGYEKGAYTGAVRAMPGKFEQAAGGTLLLDEVGEMAPELQTRLLRVLQERELERLGGRETISVDVRILAATNRDLTAAVAAGQLREDLYYRLNVFPLHLPPLRERIGDIVPLARTLLQRAAERSHLPLPRLGRDAEKALITYPWPGNVRELDNMMQRALILASGDEIGSEALLFASPDFTAQKPLSIAPIATTGGDLAETLRSQEFDMIHSALARGSRQQVAAQLGISPRTLRYKLAQMRKAGYAVADG